MITRQFVFEGDTMKINADVYGGYITIEIVDPHFKPYDGFSTEDCDPVTTDDPEQIWHTVSWKGKSDLRGTMEQTGASHLPSPSIEYLCFPVWGYQRISEKAVMRTEG